MPARVGNSPRHAQRIPLATLALTIKTFADRNREEQNSIPHRTNNIAAAHHQALLQSGRRVFRVQQSIGSRFWSYLLQLYRRGFGAKGTTPGRHVTLEAAGAMLHRGFELGLDCTHRDTITLRNLAVRNVF